MGPMSLWPSRKNNLWDQTNWKLGENAVFGGEFGSHRVSCCVIGPGEDVTLMLLNKALSQLMDLSQFQSICTTLGVAAQAVGGPCFRSIRRQTGNTFKSGAASLPSCSLELVTQKVGQFYRMLGWWWIRGYELLPKRFCQCRPPAYRSRERRARCHNLGEQLASWLACRSKNPAFRAVKRAGSSILPTFL